MRSAEMKLLVRTDLFGCLAKQASVQAWNPVKSQMVSRVMFFDAAFKVERRPQNGPFACLAKQASESALIHGAAKVWKGIVYPTPMLTA